MLYNYINLILIQQYFFQDYYSIIKTISNLITIFHLRYLIHLSNFKLIFFTTLIIHLNYAFFIIFHHYFNFKYLIYKFIYLMIQFNLINLNFFITIFNSICFNHLLCH